ncbi:MAG: hypothetical protein ACXV7D_15715, partial [Thermoanaerobaculia bacterium]
MELFGEPDPGASDDTTLRIFHGHGVASDFDLNGDGCLTVHLSNALESSSLGVRPPRPCYIRRMPTLTTDAVRLAILERLCFIIEAFAEGARGDGKEELSALIQRVERDQGFDAARRELVLSELRKADALAHSSNFQERGHVVFPLCSISRVLWKD